MAIRWPAEVEKLRQLRNATRHGFSHDTSEIGVVEQQRWWLDMGRRVEGWLYYERGGSEPVGFGVVRQTEEDGRWWTSCGVLAEHGGGGYGSAILHHLVRNAPGRCYGTARLDNPAAQRLHRIEDWEEVGRDERLVHYRTRPEVGWV